MLAPLLAAVLVPLTIHRSPANAVKKAGAKPEETRTIEVRYVGCDGLMAVRGLEHVMDVSERGKDVAVDVHTVVILEKLRKGPMAAPSFVLTLKEAPWPESDAVALDDAMASPSWEAGGTFRDQFLNILDPRYWVSAELRCTASSPYRVAVIPEEIRYKTSDDAKSAAAAKAIAAKPLGALCDATLVGADLYSAIQNDAALKVIESPKMVVMSPDTKTPRSLLRAKGEKECAALGEALGRYVGTSTPRVRAATVQELAQHWKNIGWDIEEPLLVLDYGAHRLIAEFQNGSLFMIDEVSVPPSPPPSSHAVPVPDSH
jgi:hypothetical protein